MEPFAQFIGIFCREFIVALLARQIYDGFWPETAIEMVMEQNFRQSAKDCFGEFH